MVKKTKSSTGSGKSSSSSGDLAASVKASAQQIWLAGMGAFAKAQEEGTKVFSELVKEGKNLQSKTQGIAEDKIGEVTGRMTAMADSMQSKAGQNWDKLEGLFEQRTAKAMGKLGVPTAKEVAALSTRIEQIEADMAGLSKALATRSAAGADGAAKPARKRAAGSAKTATAAPKSTAKADRNSAGKSAVKSARKSSARRTAAPT